MQPQRHRDLLAALFRLPVRGGTLFAPHVQARFRYQRHEEHVEEVGPVQPRWEADGGVVRQRLEPVVAGDKLRARSCAHIPTRPDDRRGEQQRAKRPREPPLADALRFLLRSHLRGRGYRRRFRCGAGSLTAAPGAASGARSAAGGTTTRTQLFLDAVADQEQPEVSQQELTDHILFTAQSYGMDPNQFVAQLQQSGQIANLFSDVRRGKALAIAISRTQVADEAGNTVDPNEYFGEAEENAADTEAVESEETTETTEADEK